MEFPNQNKNIIEKQKRNNRLILVSLFITSAILVLVAIKRNYYDQYHHAGLENVELSSKTHILTKRDATCSSACQSGGQCIGTNICQCPVGYTGSTCATSTTSSCSAGDLATFDPILSITFGQGTTAYSSKTPSEFGFTTTYTQVVSGVPQDGNFAIVKRVPGNSGAWHGTALDYTSGDGNNGYMLLVNAGYEDGEFAQFLLTSLTAGNQYRFSAYLANAVVNGKNYLLPDVTFQIRTATSDYVLVAETSTGPILEVGSLTWQQHSITFVSPSASVVVLMISNVGSGSGNDLVIDNIDLQGCAPSSPLVTCSSPCLNDGVCVSNNLCNCPDGYIGPSCETEITNYCSVDDITPISTMTFSFGSTQFSTATPTSLGFSTRYSQRSSGISQDGQFAILNSIPGNSGTWHGAARDHTAGDGIEGYMLLVNPDYRSGEFFRTNLTSLTIGDLCQVSVYIGNAVKAGQSLLEPDISFQVRSTSTADVLYEEGSTGSIPKYGGLVWQKYSLSFLATDTSVVFLMSSSSGTGTGDTVVIDDITLTCCTPVNPSLTCSSPCLNGGQCIGNNVCLCPDGFIGANCQTRLAGFCTVAELINLTPISTITFGAGIPIFSTQNAASFGLVITGLTPVTTGIPQNGRYAFVNSIPNNNNRWLTGGLDHTNDVSDSGYMLLINRNNVAGEFLTATMNGLTVDYYYMISIYVANIVKSGSNLVEPDVTLKVISTASDNALLGYASSGPLPEANAMTWYRVDVSFKALVTSVILIISSNAGGSAGGDFVIDDIEIRVCQTEIPRSD